MYASFAIANFFNKQPPNTDWNDFINANYETGYRDTILFPALEYFIGPDTLEPDPRFTTLPRDLQTDYSLKGYISIQVGLDQSNLQDSLGSQNSNVEITEMRTDYKEIKAIYREYTRSFDLANVFQG